MPLLQTPILGQISYIALALVGLGLGLALPAGALVVNCDQGGTCTVVRSATNPGVSSPDLQFAAASSVDLQIPSSFSSTLLDDLLQSALTNDGCRRGVERSVCVSPSMRVNQHRRFGVRIHFGSDSQFGNWLFGPRPVAQIPGPVVTQPGGITNPIPEPSAALIFGVGLLVASGLVTRTGSID